ncbi:hypothetical protein JL722_5923 [Aureococcus anophagefferens]|nr:hypothetical protein JL722_5923 [Aureococcus anophagefferens]
MLRALALLAACAQGWVPRHAPLRRRSRTALRVTVPVPLEYAAELAATASALVNPGKGLLASDESPPTLNARLERAGLVNSEDTRRAYREALYTTPDLGACTADGTPFVDLLNVNGIVPGVRVDAGAVQLPGAIAGETCSRGLDGLDERAALYREQGARFAKWRSRIKITGDGAPSLLALKENCWTMAREGAHSIERAAEVQERVYVDVFRALAENGVFLEGAS